MLIEQSRIDQYKKYVDMSLGDLIAIANNIRKEQYGTDITTCSIVNAKSGKCSEDCKFCAQSAHYKTDAQVYDMLDKSEIVKQAKEADSNGAKRFGIVTSGKGLSKKDIPEVIESLKEISNNTNLRSCGSLGVLDKDTLLTLKEAGLKRVHHNLETSERFYDKIVSTHPFIDRYNTVKFSKELGLEVCSGGIFGLGESWEDRIEMALILKELDVDNVPINFLNPIKGTPMENQKILSIDEAIRVIAIYRIILGGTSIEVAAGREVIFRDSQLLIFMAGANSIMVGGYLTQRGRSVEQDSKLLEDAKQLFAQL